MLQQLCDCRGPVSQAIDVTMQVSHALLQYKLC
jgi:hypothetical protein